MSSGSTTTTRTDFWTDPDLAGWHPLTRLLYLYLYQNHHVDGTTGIGRIGARTIQNETRLTPRHIERAKEQMGKRVRWYPDGTYWVSGRAKHTCYGRDGAAVSKRAIHAQHVLAEQCPQLQADFRRKYPNLDTPTIPYPTLPPDTVSVTDAVTVSETDNNTLVENSTRGVAEKIQDAWNEMATAHGLSKVRTLSNGRRKHLRERLRNTDWTESWREALGKIPESAFLLGSGDRGWKANFDWFIRPDIVARLLEDIYSGDGADKRDW